MRKSTARLIATFIACVLFCAITGGVKADTQQTWLSQWKMKQPRFWKTEGDKTQSITHYMALMSSTRKDLRDFDLRLRFSRNKEYESANQIGLVIERDSGNWRLLFTGKEIIWFFAPEKPATKKESYGLYKVKTPFVCPMGAVFEAFISCRQDGITLSMNGVELGKLRPSPGRGAISLYTYRLGCEILEASIITDSREPQSTPKKVTKAKAPPQANKKSPKTPAKPAITKNLKPTANPPSTMNFVANPGFELCANPDIPDGWTHEPSWGAEGDERWFRPGGMERWHKSWGIQEKRVFQGKRCMRVRHPLELHATVIQMAKGGNYVLSAHLRADRDNFGVFMGASTPGQPRQGGLVRVGRTWKRYSVKLAPYNLRAHPYRSICIVPLEPNPGGMLWVDAVQLEKGAEMTPFTPFSPLDIPFTNTKQALETGGAGGIPEAEVTRPFKGKFKLDGVLDEPMWSTVKTHILNTTSGGPTRFKTTIRFAATPKGLLIASSAVFPGVAPVAVTQKRDSTGVFGDDSVEVFIDPVGEGREYYQFVFNSAGTRFDSKCQTGKGVDFGWNGNWRVAAKYADGVWTAEAFFPFSDIFPGESFPEGAAIRVNICRTAQPHRELQNWSTTYGVFHLPDRFGYLFLGDVSAAQKVADKKVVQTKAGVEAFFEYSYYTTEANANLYIKDLSNAGSAGATVDISSPGGKRVFKASVKLTGGNRGVITIPVKSWTPGKYRARVSCQNTLKELTLSKLPPSDVREVKVDYLRRTIRVDGKPFFPFGPLFCGWTGADMILFVREAGFNTVWMGNKWNPLAHEQRPLTLMDQVGLNLVETRYLHFEKPDAAQRIAGFINNTGKHRCVIARMDIDEPGGERQPEKAKQMLKLAAKLNPYVPSYANHNSWGMFQRYAGLPGPIMSIDRYPIGSTPPNEIYTVEKVVEYMEKEAAPRRMPVWIILQSVGHRRNPTAAELNFMTYIAIIRGASGITYWAGIPRPRGTWNRMKELSREIEALTPILFSVEPTPQIKIRPEPTVTAITRQHDGATYVIALNRSSSPCSADIFVDTPDKLSTCSVLFESREVPVVSNKISDRFGPFERHVYRMRRKGK